MNWKGLEIQIREYLEERLPSTWDFHEEVREGKDPLPARFHLTVVENYEVEIGVSLLGFLFQDPKVVKFNGRTTDPDLLVESAAIMRDLKEIVRAWVEQAKIGT